ncbi:hypothetical protein JCM3775_001748 [Rhodotorula graminis]
MSAVLASLPDLPAVVQPGTTLNGKRIRVPPRVNLGDLTPNNLGTVKKLHACLFPVVYSPSFFDSLLNPAAHPEDYNKLVFYQDLPVGVVVCRLELSDAATPKTLAEAAAATKVKEVDGADKDKAKAGSPAADNGKSYKLYIMTLGVLAPYRHQGLGSKLIHHVLTSAAATHVPPKPKKPVSKPAPAPPATNGSSAKGKKGAAPPPPVLAKKDDKKKDDEDEEEEKPRPKVDSVYLHVQVGNDDARRFWEKWGFQVKDTVADYYRKIEPRDAWLLERTVEPQLSEGASASA